MTATAIPSAAPANAAATAAARAARISTMPDTPTCPPRHSRTHSQAMTPAASTVNMPSQGEPNQTAAMATGAMTSADRMRSAKGLGSARANRGTVAALASAIIGDRLFQIGAPEIRPQRLGKDELGIGALPQQEVADALLAAGADQEIRVREIHGQQMRGDQLLVDSVEGQRPGSRFGRDGAHRSGDLGAAAIG